VRSPSPDRRSPFTSIVLDCNLDLDLVQRAQGGIFSKGYICHVSTAANCTWHDEDKF